MPLDDDAMDLSVALELGAAIGSVLRELVAAPLAALVDDPIVGSMDMMLFVLLIELIELTTDSLGGCGGAFPADDVTAADSDSGIGKAPSPSVDFSSTLLSTLAGDTLLAGLIPLFVTAFSNCAVS